MVEFTSNRESKKCVSHTMLRRGKRVRGKKRKQLVSTANSHRFLSSSLSFYVEGKKAIRNWFFMKISFFSVCARARIGISLFLFKQLCVRLCIVFGLVLVRNSLIVVVIVHQRMCMCVRARAMIKRKRTVLHI